MSDPFTHLTLSQYLEQVKGVITASFNKGVWVKAEIRNLSSKSGHYYFELAEKDEASDQTIASCKAVVWKFNAKKVID